MEINTKELNEMGYIVEEHKNTINLIKRTSSDTEEREEVVMIKPGVVWCHFEASYKDGTKVSGGMPIKIKLLKHIEALAQTIVPLNEKKKV